MRHVAEAASVNCHMVRRTDGYLPAQVLLVLLSTATDDHAATRQGFQASAINYEAKSDLCILVFAKLALL